MLSSEGQIASPAFDVEGTDKHKNQLSDNDTEGFTK